MILDDNDNDTNIVDDNYTNIDDDNGTNNDEINDDVLPMTMSTFPAFASPKIKLKVKLNDFFNDELLFWSAQLSMWNRARGNLYIREGQPYCTP